MTVEMFTEMTMAPLAAWLVTIHDWRTAMLIIAGIAAVLMIPAALLVRRPPALDGGQPGMAADEPQSDMTVARAVRSPQFITLMLANFFCCATHSGPIFHTVSYAVTSAERHVHDVQITRESPNYRIG